MSRRFSTAQLTQPGQADCLSVGAARHECPEGVAVVLDGAAPLGKDVEALKDAVAGGAGEVPRCGLGSGARAVLGLDVDLAGGEGNIEGGFKDGGTGGCQWGL